MKAIYSFVASVLALAFGLAASAQAALPAGISTAIDAATTDGTTLVGLMAAGGAAVYIIWRILGKMGIKF